MTHRTTLYNEKRHPRPGKERAPKAKRTPVPGITWLDAYVPRKVKPELPKNKNRRLDEALKILNKGGVLTKEVVGEGKKRLERFYVKFQNKTWKVRKKIAILLFKKNVLETTAKVKSLAGTVWCYALSQMGKAWASQVILVRAK
jgi:hypothetical protein